MADRRPPPRPGNTPPRRSSRPGAPQSRPGGSHSRPGAPQSRPGGSHSRPGAPQSRPGGPPRRPDARPQSSARPVGPKREPRQTDQDSGNDLDRLQKVLAHAGIGSRRSCEELITQGRITIDGKVARELGTKVDSRTQQVALDGQKIHSERNVYYAVHKPKGYVSTNHDPSGKPRVIDLLPEIPQRAYAVGRLDEQSTGLMLLTNDGELANKLAHPKFGVEKIYRVVVAGEPGHEILDQLTKGIWLAEGKVRAKRVRIVGHKGQASIMEMVLAEGKNREIRRMLAKMGHKVMSLTRIAIGPIGLKGIAVGECRALTGREVELLRLVASGQLVPTPRFPDRRERTPRPSGPRTGTRPSSAAQEASGPPPTQSRDGAPPRFPATAGRPSQGPRKFTGQGSAPRPGQSQGQGNGPRPRPPQGQDGGPRPRPVQGQSGGPRSRPPQGQGNGPRPRPIQGQGRGPGPVRRPASGAPMDGPPPVAKRPDQQPSDGPPTRRIIGLDPESGPRSGGPKIYKPAPKRAPRAALGVRRARKPDDSAE